MSRFAEWSTKKSRFLIALMLVAVLGAACGGDDSGEDGGAGGAADQTVTYGGAGEEAAPKAAGNDGLGSGDSAAYEGSGGGNIPALGESVIKTADLRIEVERNGVRDAVQSIEQTAPRYGGFVHSTTVEAGSDAEGVVVIRVPSDEFELALRDVKRAGRVEAEHVSGKDVSQEFIDLEARIRNLEAQEAVLLDLMEKATTIAETINVQNDLSGIQLDIEQLRGRLGYLEDRTALGTISVALVEEGAPDPEPVAASTWSRAWTQAIDILEGLGAGSILLLVGFAFPLGAVFLVGYLIFRAVKPRFTSS